MRVSVGEDTTLGNAEALERALARRRRELQELGGDDEQRERHIHALALMEGYTSLLREPSPSATRNAFRYCFKLVFPDGRWSVDEKQLAQAPQDGDVVHFAGYGDWRVQGTQRVMPRPSGKPAREFLVCAPAS
jgi:hypothetical protein